MEQLIVEVEEYAAACGLKPGTVVQRAVGASGVIWQRWKEGGSCSMRTADRIRAWMAANPPENREDAA